MSLQRSRRPASGIFNRTVDFARPAPQQPRMDARPADLDLVFAALADAHRRAILTDLLAGAQSVGALAAPHAISLAAVSKHIAILARAGLVSQIRVGRETRCRLEPDGLRAAGLWMQGMGGFAPEDYDALEALVAAALDEGSGDRLDDALGRGEVD
jgi:DNA-binding transcriptional ArsR family regulator